MDVEQIWTSFKATLYERASSPLVVSFAVAWCLVNFRLFLIIFGDAPLADKLWIIDTYIFTGTAKSLLNLLAYPLSGALFYLFALPWPAKKVYKYWLNIQGELSDIKNEKEGRRLLSLEASQQILRQMAELRKAHDEQISQLVAERNALLKTPSNSGADQEKKPIRIRKSSVLSSSRPDTKKSGVAVIGSSSEISKHGPSVEDLREQLRSAEEDRKFLPQAEAAAPVGLPRDLVRILKKIDGPISVQKLFGKLPSKKESEAINQLFIKGVIKTPDDATLPPDSIEFTQFGRRVASFM